MIDEYNMGIVHW